MELLGPSLHDLFQFCNKKFSLKTNIIIGIQLINLIRKMHENDLIHSDIKPENCLIGVGEKSNFLHLMDMGLT